MAMQLEFEMRERALKQQLQKQAALIKAERKRARRDAKTVRTKAAQAERRNEKAAGRKRKAARAAQVKCARRKDDERGRKNKRPAGEPLHSGELKHRRLISPTHS